jgi:hypothetical protein
MTNPALPSSRPCRTRGLARFTAALALALLAGTTGPLQAHNAAVHRDMTDRAYEILLALATTGRDC